MANKKWCRHYRALAFHDTCEIGVEYESVRDKETRPYRWPCTDAAIRHLCPLYEGYTEEEIAEDNRKTAELINKINALTLRETEECWLCGKTITHMKQVGRCTYAEPCGCRLWQGKVPKAWKS